VDATLSFPPDLRAQEVELHIRHPEGKKISIVQVDGKTWDAFDAANSSIVLPVSTGTRHVHAEYR
jgi:outer membrane lipoprotein SlyB